LFLLEKKVTQIELSKISPNPKYLNISYCSS